MAATVTIKTGDTKPFSLTSPCLPNTASMNPAFAGPKRPHSLFTMFLDVCVERFLEAARHKERTLSYPDGCTNLRPALSANSQKNGGAGRDRTDDLMLAKQLLSQLSYSPNRENRPSRKARQVTFRAIPNWWAWDDSNVRPHPYQGCALTN